MTPKNVQTGNAMRFAAVLPVGRDRKVLPALRTNQIAGFLTVPSRKK